MALQKMLGDTSHFLLVSATILVSPHQRRRKRKGRLLIDLGNLSISVIDLDLQNPQPETSIPSRYSLDEQMSLLGRRLRRTEQSTSLFWEASSSVESGTTSTNNRCLDEKLDDGEIDGE